MIPAAGRNAEGKGIWVIEDGDFDVEGIEFGGTASYEVDLPNGGDALLRENQIEQGAHTQNPVIVSFGEEGYRWRFNELILERNTAVNRRADGVFVRVSPGVPPGSWFGERGSTYRKDFYRIDEVTTHHRFRGNKFRLEVRERDHGPAHCHLVGGDVDVIIELATLRTEGAWPRGLRSEVMAWVRQHVEDLWAEWNKWHP